MPKPKNEQWQREIDQLAESVKLTIDPEDNYLEPLPHWAVGTTPGKLCLGAQLPTKDGRVTGNAHIIAMDVPPRGVLGPIYTILTDAGNTARLTESEIYGQYHSPYWISDVVAVCRRFRRDRLLSTGNGKGKSGD